MKSAPWSPRCAGAAVAARPALLAAAPALAAALRETAAAGGAAAAAGAGAGRTRSSWPGRTRRCASTSATSIRSWRSWPPRKGRLPAAPRSPPRRPHRGPRARCRRRPQRRRGTLRRCRQGRSRRRLGSSFGSLEPEPAPVGLRRDLLHSTRSTTARRPPWTWRARCSASATSSMTTPSSTPSTRSSTRSPRPPTSGEFEVEQFYVDRRLNDAVDGARRAVPHAVRLPQRAPRADQLLRRTAQLRRDAHHPQHLARGRLQPARRHPLRLQLERRPDHRAQPVGVGLPARIPAVPAARSSWATTTPRRCGQPPGAGSWPMRAICRSTSHSATTAFRACRWAPPSAPARRSRPAASATRASRCGRRTRAGSRRALTCRRCTRTAASATRREVNAAQPGFAEPDSRVLLRLLPAGRLPPVGARRLPPGAVRALRALQPRGELCRDLRSRHPERPGAAVGRAGRPWPVAAES